MSSPSLMEIYFNYHIWDWLVDGRHHVGINLLANISSPNNLDHKLSKDGMSLLITTTLPSPMINPELLEGKHPAKVAAHKASVLEIQDSQPKMGNYHLKGKVQHVPLLSKWEQEFVAW